MTADEVKAYGLTLMGTTTDCPFRDDFVSTVLRHVDTRKWFGLLMRIDGRHVGRKGNVDVLNVKVDPALSSLLQEKYDWVLPSYHMNKRLWATVVLQEADETVVKQLLDHSYALTAGALRPKKRSIGKGNKA